MTLSKHFQEKYVAGMADAAYRLVEKRGATLARPGRTLETLACIVAWALDDGFEKGVAAEVVGRNRREAGETREVREVPSDDARADKSIRRAVVAFDRGYDAGKLLGIAEGRAELLAEMQVAVERNNVNDAA